MRIVFRHAAILSLFGVRHVLLAVNKMDRVGFDQAVFDDIASRFGAHAQKLGIPDVVAIPVAAAVGDNVTTRSDAMPWYEGSSVLAHLVVSKVIDATPIERAGRQWARYGYDLAPSTMHDWFGRSAGEVAFLSPLAREDVLRSQLVSFDDTPMPAKVAGHANGTQRGRLARKLVAELDAGIARGARLAQARLERVLGPERREVVVAPGERVDPKPHCRGHERFLSVS
jgi:hypothetical protein